MHGGAEGGKTFASLAYPEYRRLWISGVIVFMAVNAQGIARGWLAKEITGTNLFICGLLGLLVTALIVVITEYYTGTNKRPVNSIAQASVTGHGTNVIQGLAVSLESTALPAIVIVGGIIATYQLAGLFGTGIAYMLKLVHKGPQPHDAEHPIEGGAGQMRTPARPLSASDDR